MKKKRLLTVAFISLLLFFAIAETQFPNSVSANPYYEQTWGNVPIVSVYSPSVNETFYSTEILLNFTITKPTGQYVWLEEGTYLPQITGNEEVGNALSSVDIFLDDTIYRSIGVNSNLSSSFNYSTTLTNLTLGVHNLRIQTTCEGWNVEVHGMWTNRFTYTNSSGLTVFTVDKKEPFHTTSVAVTSVGAVAVVSMGLFVYFKKRKH